MVLDISTVPYTKLPTQRLDNIPGHPDSEKQIVDGDALVDAVDAADVRPFQNHRRKSVCRIAQATPVVAVGCPGHQERNTPASGECFLTVSVTT